jgi:hypothetical protein
LKIRRKAYLPGATEVYRKDPPEAVPSSSLSVQSCIVTRNVEESLGGFEIFIVPLQSQKKFGDLTFSLPKTMAAESVENPSLGKEPSVSGEPGEASDEVTSHILSAQSNYLQRRKYDLTQKLVPFLDRHLIFPLLEFLSQEDMYPAMDLVQAKYDLLKPTNMTDYTGNLWKEIHDSDDIPAEFAEKRQQVLATLRKLEEESQKVISVLEDPEVVSALRQDKTQNLQFLKDNYAVL